MPAKYAVPSMCKNNCNLKMLNIYILGIFMNKTKPQISNTWIMLLKL